MRLLLLGLVSCAQLAFGQDCPPFVSTDPRNPTNPLRPELENTFFWFPHDGNDHDTFDMNTATGAASDLNSPFWSSTSQAVVGLLASGPFSDFYPEDGWELLKVNFGKLADGSLRESPPGMPYMMLYNRFTGVVRFLGTWANALPVDQMNFTQINRFTVTLPNKQVGGEGALKATNLLSIQGHTAQPLDQATDHVFYELTTQYLGLSPLFWFSWFDLPVAYDPCSCSNNAAFVIQAYWELYWNYTLKHDDDDTPLQAAFFPPLAFNPRPLHHRIIGATTPVTSDFTDETAITQTGRQRELLDYYIARQNLTEALRTQLELLKKLTVGSSTMVFDPMLNAWLNTEDGTLFDEPTFLQTLMQLGPYLNRGFDFDNTAQPGPNINTSIVSGIGASGNRGGLVQWHESVYLGIPGTAWTAELEEEVVSTAEGYEPEYPTYNNPLGTFALLKTPTLKAHMSQESVCSTCPGIDVLAGTPNQPSSPGCHDKPVTYVKFFFDQETLRYALNPVMNPDFEHTEIYASFVVREKGATIIESTPCLDLIASGSSGPEQVLCNLCCGDNALEVLNRLSGTNMVKSVDPKERVSHPVPVDFINEVVAEVALEDHLSDLSGLDISIRFLLNFQSTDLNQQGQPFTSTQVISFPVNVELTSAEPPIPTVDVLESDFQGLFPQPPATASFISDYCAFQTPGITYRADQFSEVALAMLDGTYFVPSPEPVVNNEMIIYPNPARNTATVVSPLLNIEELAIYDQTGRLLRKFEISHGVNEVCLSLDPFTAGLYQVAVTTRGETKVLKLLIND